MNQRSFDLGLFVAVFLTLFLVAVAARAEPERVLTAWPSIGVGHKVHSGALGIPQLGLSVPLFDVMEPEVTAGLGLNAGGAEAEVVNRFSFGVRWFFPEAGAFSTSEPVRPFLWTALHHGHKVLVADAMKNPVGALSTSSEAGVGHLTGAEAGLGVLLGLPVDDTVVPLLLRVSGAWLPAFAFGHAHGAEERDDVLVYVDFAFGLPLSLTGDRSL